MDKEFENKNDGQEQNPMQEVTETEVNVARQNGDTVSASAAENKQNGAQNKSAAAVIEKEVEVARHEEKEKKSPLTIVLYIVIALLAAACVYGAVRYFGADTQEEQTKTETENTTSATEETEYIAKEDFLVPTEGVIATVNGVEVDGNLYDFYKAQNVYTFEAYGISLTPDICAYLEQMCFSNAVQNECMQQLADQEGITATTEEAQEMVDEIVSMYFTDEAEYAQWLADMGCTEEQYLQNMYYNLLANKLYEKCLASVSVTEEEAKAIYDEDPAQYDTRKTSHILIMFEQAGDTLTDEEKLAAYNEALAVLEKVKENPDNFAELAKEYSDDGSASAGGVIDYSFTKYDTSLFSEYVEGAWALEGVGDFSPEPVESSAGYHIIKIDEETKGFENFSEQIQETLLTQRTETKFNDLFGTFVDEAEIIQVFDFQYSEKLEF